MLEKAIEGWLTSAGEKGYQPAFVSLLMHQGHSVLYSSKHRPLEEGKDVVSRDPNGRLCAYQLKGGRIDIGTWRSIRGELDELVSMAVRHPSTRADESVRAYLVTNGRIVDEVMVRIAEYNAQNAARGNGWAVLDVIQGEALLGMFLDMGREVIPVLPDQAKELFTLYTSDGTDLIPIATLEGVLRALCFPEGTVSDAAFESLATRSILVTSFVLMPYERAANHFALIQGWTVLGMGLARFAYAQDRDDQQATQAVLGIILDRLNELAEALKEEALARENLLEGDWRGDGGDLYRARVTIVAGTIAASALIEHDRSGARIDERIGPLVLKLAEQMWIWSEGAIPLVMCVIRCLEVLRERAAARALLKSTLTSLIAGNRKGGTKGWQPLPSPYTSAEEVLLDMYDPDPSRERIDRSEYVGSSWMLHSLVHMCVRRDMKSELEELWRDISHMLCLWFEDDGAKAYCEVISESGVTRHGYLPSLASWADLQTQARRPVKSARLWPLWGVGLVWVMLLCPYRWQEGFGGLVDALGEKGSS